MSAPLGWTGRAETRTKFRGLSRIFSGRLLYVRRFPGIVVAARHFRAVSQA
jgi:hypothetical protein